MVKRSGKNPRVSVGQINYYVPSPKAGMAEDVAKFLDRAGWKIPGALRGLGTHLDGSNWYFPTAVYPEVKKVRDEWDSQNGVRFYLTEKVEWEDEDELWRAIRDAISESVQEVGQSLKGSLGRLREKFADIEPQEGDSQIVDRVRDAKAKLEDLAVVIASFALTEDYDQAREAVAKMLEAELVAARTELWKENRHIQAQLKAAGVKQSA